MFGWAASALKPFDSKITITRVLNNIMASIGNRELSKAKCC
jgi:hypothetical protein